MHPSPTSLNMMTDSELRSYLADLRDGLAGASGPWVAERIGAIEGLLAARSVQRAVQSRLRRRRGGQYI